MKQAELLSKLNDDLVSYDRNPETIRTYLSVAKTFLEFIQKKGKKDFDDSDVASFLAKLREVGNRDNSIRYAHYALRRLFLVNKLSFSRRPPEIKTVSQPLFTQEQIEKIIRSAKICCNAQEKAFLVMASVYALRRGEITSITPVDIDKKRHIIFIRTEKRGIQRTQFIPENIRKYIYFYDWLDKVSKARASVMFGGIMLKCKYNDLPIHAGWHMFRRSCVTCLVQLKVDGATISKFLRWRSQQMTSGSPMLGIYDHTPASQADEAVFAVHPFLSLW